MHRIASGLALCAVLAAGSSHASPLNRSLGCLYDLAAYPDLPAVDVLARCPEVEGVVVNSGWESMLGSDWRATHSAKSLYDFLFVFDDYAIGQPRNLEFDTGLLDEILADLNRPTTDANEESLLGRFFERIGNALESWFPSLTDPIRRWWEGLDLNLPFTPGLSDMFRQVVAWTAAIVLCVIIWRLARRYDLIRFFKRSSIEPPLDVAETSSVLALDDVEQAPLSDRPRLLLRWLLYGVEQRQESISLEPLTHRQLIQRLKFPRTEHRQQFGNLVNLAERSAYDDWCINQSDYTKALAAAKLLNSAAGSIGVAST